MQCQPQFAQLEAGMQQLDKRFFREKQKLDPFGRDCCVIPTLCELFPKLKTRAIQERCGMIDKYRAYEREMQVIFACLQCGRFIHCSSALSILLKATCANHVQKTYPLFALQLCPSKCCNWTRIRHLVSTKYGQFACSDMCHGI